MRTLLDVENFKYFSLKNQKSADKKSKKYKNII